jgi:cyclophilin family peptidyl-prolyl cis-trans isomerase/HEAT repeat protein
MKYLLLVFLCVVTVTCYKSSTQYEPGDKTGAVEKNIFQDKVLQQVYTLQNRRDANGLTAYLKDTNPGYRKAAALAFASVQAAEAIKPLAKLLEDDRQAVRSAAAYALGQVKNKAAVPLLIKAYKTESSPAVKRDILEAIGKCGTKEGLTFIIGLKFENPQHRSFLLEGQAWGLYRSLLRNVVTSRGTALAFRLLEQDMPDKVRFIAANYLMRAVRLNLTGYHKQLLRVFAAEKNLYTRMALVIAMGMAKHPDISAQLKSIVTSGKDMDYRLRANAVRALGRFDYEEVKEILLDKTADSNVHVAVAASEYFSSGGRQTDADRYFEIAKQSANWRSRANMLGAALQHNRDREKQETVSQWIITAYRQSSNNYEKAYLLRALAGDIRNARFVESQAFASLEKETVLSTYAIEALVTMGRAVKENKEKLKTFARVYRRALESGDPSMIGLTAGILRDPEMNFKEIYPDTGFLTDALNNCQLPRDIEAWQELKKTIVFFNGTAEKTAESAPPTKNRPIDWERVTSIPPNRRVRIKTSRGDIIIQLLIDDAPGSAANFIRLVKQGFYKKSVFHRVVPNFVIQDGCPRGDGWGGPTFTIGSELGPLYYEEGSVGMASAGKDTEGSQWFITHSPTPHLDGRYTIFAKVVAGMEIVHQIEVGDRVLGFDIL